MYEVSRASVKSLCGVAEDLVPIWYALYRFWRSTLGLHSVRARILDCNYLPRFYIIRWVFHSTVNGVDNL
jgi:hypothetical protein